MLTLPLKLIIFIALQVVVGYLVSHFYRRFKQGRDRTYFFVFCVGFLANLFTVLREFSSYLALGPAWPEVTPTVVGVAFASLALGAKLDGAVPPPQSPD